ncbi:uncharacterized protein BDR25DRAFT_396325 [Lindgomyces ingoldianus]|uniref:Uncharacterized protein n=1 Tax=Lindgomyces ingoldianus TaxID=673940 RepID=A0ACB6QGT2_9PLEO|nr:uncharacterized protein BDR25DRAFT_396325 [Lindgomyces ingoldianus]KAF2465351.1 hypothetical protein BDR25DRAFT_396325 [Lindgomyces ingoldianus]
MAELQQSSEYSATSIPPLAELRNLISTLEQRTANLEDATERHPEDTDELIEMAMDSKGTPESINGLYLMGLNTLTEANELLQNSVVAAKDRLGDEAGRILRGALEKYSTAETRDALMEAANVTRAANFALNDATQAFDDANATVRRCRDCRHEKFPQFGSHSTFDCINACLQPSVFSRLAPGTVFWHTPVLCTLTILLTVLVQKKSYPIFGRLDQPKWSYFPARRRTNGLNILHQPGLHQARQMQTILPRKRPLLVMLYLLLTSINFCFTDDVSAFPPSKQVKEFGFFAFRRYDLGRSVECKRVQRPRELRSMLEILWMGLAWPVWALALIVVLPVPTISALLWAAWWVWVRAYHFIMDPISYTYYKVKHFWAWSEEMKYQYEDGVMCNQMSRVALSIITHRDKMRGGTFEAEPVVSFATRTHSLVARYICELDVLGTMKPHLTPLDQCHQQTLVRGYHQGSTKFSYMEYPKIFQTLGGTVRDVDKCGSQQLSCTKNRQPLRYDGMSQWESFGASLLASFPLPFSKRLVLSFRHHYTESIMKVVNMAFKSIIAVSTAIISPQTPSSTTDISPREIITKLDTPANTPALTPAILPAVAPTVIPTVTPSVAPANNTIGLALETAANSPYLAPTNVIQNIVSLCVDQKMHCAENITKAALNTSLATNVCDTADSEKVFGKNQEALWPSPCVVFASSDKGLFGFTERRLKLLGVNES